MINQSYLGGRKRSRSQIKDGGVKSGDSGHLFYCLLLVCPKKARDDNGALFSGAWCVPVVNRLMDLPLLRPHLVCGLCDQRDITVPRHPWFLNVSSPSQRGCQQACWYCGPSSTSGDSEAGKAKVTSGRVDCAYPGAAGHFLGLLDFSRKRLIGIFKLRVPLQWKEANRPSLLGSLSRGGGSAGGGKCCTSLHRACHLAA